MRDQIVPKLHKWPFFLGDVLLLGLAFYICFQSTPPLHRWEIAACVLCVALGAALGVLPFISEYRAIVKLAEVENFVSVASQIQNLEEVATQISSATNHWQMAQDAADKTTKAAKEISDGMAAELRKFTEFMQRADAGEKAALRLEAEKSRRAENEWMQVIVRMLDHVYALHAAAARSGQAGLARQIDNFQNACRDAARRVGLVPFVAQNAEAFDAQKHQLVEEDAKAPEGALVAETLATGYTFQGRLLRPAIVTLQSEKTSTETVDQPPHQLPLESANS